MGPKIWGSGFGKYVGLKNCWPKIIVGVKNIEFKKFGSQKRHGYEINFRSEKYFGSLALVFLSNSSLTPKTRS